jgi:hypothetical protein
MCVIALSPVGQRLDKSTLDDMWNTNPDGAGISFIDETQTIRTYKTLDKADFVNVALSVFDKYSVSSPILVHCRIATHGSVCIANTHPFNVDNHTVMAHNGVIECVEVPDTSDISDTRMFINTWLRYMRPTWLDDKDMVDYVGTIIGWSKLAFLTTNPNLRRNYYIVNEDDGSWIDGVWFSNKNHCTLPTTNYYGVRGWDFVDDDFVDYISVGDNIELLVHELSEFTGFEVKQLYRLPYADIQELFILEYGACEFTQAQWNSFTNKTSRV